jgi:hypothetical protein
MGNRKSVPIIPSINATLNITDQKNPKKFQNSALVEVPEN